LVVSYGAGISGFTARGYRLEGDSAGICVDGGDRVWYDIVDRRGNGREGRKNVGFRAEMF